MNRLKKKLMNALKKKLIYKLETNTSLEATVFFIGFIIGNIEEFFESIGERIGIGK